MYWNRITDIDSDADTDTDTYSVVNLLLELCLISLNEFCSFSNGSCNLGKLIQISRLRKDTRRYSWLRL